MVSCECFFQFRQANQTHAALKLAATEIDKTLTGRVRYSIATLAMIATLNRETVVV
jgi:hypothetical protein